MSDASSRPGKADIATWAGFLLMCLGMFMAILDIQVVATSLPTIQRALAISPDAMSWIQTAYLIAEVIAIPLTGLFTRVLSLRWLFVTAVSLFTLASIGCAFSGGFARAAGFPRGAGIFRRRADPGGIFGGVSAVSAAAPRRRHHARRCCRGAGADDRAGGRRLDHGDLVVAVAVPDQCHSRADRGARRRRCCCRGRTPISANSRSSTSSRLSLLAASLASLEIGLKEAPQRGWLSPACIALLAASAVGIDRLDPPPLRAAHPVLRL